MFYKICKRFVDLLIATVLLILTGIPMLIIAAAIKLEDGQEVIFKQKRMGKGLQPFNIYKFRTMKKNREELHSNLTHDQMVTKVGKFLRKTSLDELPQIFNVFKGEMSFIGPRPWITEYYEWFTDEQKKRCDVLPGVSGLAQIKGRNGIDINQKIAYDLVYVDNFGLWMDFKVIILTVIAVLKKSNAEISESGIKEEISMLKTAFQKISKTTKCEEQEEDSLDRAVNH